MWQKYSAIIVLLVFGFLTAILVHQEKSPKNTSKFLLAQDKEAPGPDYYPAEWAWIRRTFPFGRADNSALRLALQQRQQLGLLNKRTATADWQFVGPDNIGGRVVDVEFNPQNPQVVYAAAATGGVFRSDDGGFSWQAVFDEMAVLTIGDIAVDPIEPDILYVGTGEANGGHNNFPGGGIYKSTDGGLNWRFSGLENTASIGRILVDPLNHQRIVVAAVGSYFAPNPERGVYISTDGGNSWDQSLFVSDSTGAIDLVMDKQNPDIMLAAMWERVRRPVQRSATHLYGRSSGIYRTIDGGRSWQRLGGAQGLPDSTTLSIGRIGLSMQPGSGSNVFALYNDGNAITGLYRTSDGGDSWVRTSGLPDLKEGTGGFSWYFGQVRVHPTNPDIVYVLDVALMRSMDGGQSFPLRYGYGGYENLHVDHHALAFHPHNPDYLIDGNDGGINISTDGGVSWKKVSALPVTQFYEINYDPANPAYLIGGTQDNGTLRTHSAQAADWQRVYGGDGFYAIIDPTDENIIFAESQFGNLAKSDDGGRTFRNILNDQMKLDDSNWSTPVIMDPHNHLTLYYGTNRLWRTLDGGNSWQAISQDLTRRLDDSRVGTITTIAVAPTDSNTIYAGTDDGLVWVSTDHGAHWENVSDGLPFRWVTRVVPDWNNANIVYATYSGLRWKDPQPHVFRSADFGQSWTDISGNLPDAPVNAFAVDPFHPEVLYLGSDVGAFVSFDQGAGWQVLGRGLPAVVINDIKVIPESYELVAGTHGRSAYKLDLTGITTLWRKDYPAQYVRTVKLFQNYPNPFNPVTTISYQLSEISDVDLSIYNTLGQRVATLVSEKQQAGTYEVKWDASGFAGGVYFCKMHTGRGFKQTSKLVLIR